MPFTEWSCFDADSRMSHYICTHSHHHWDDWISGSTYKGGLNFQSGHIIAILSVHRSNDSLSPNASSCYLLSWPLCRKDSQALGGSSVREIHGSSGQSNPSRQAITLFATIMYLAEVRVPVPGIRNGRFYWYRVPLFGQYPVSLLSLLISLFIPFSISLPFSPRGPFVSSSQSLV